VDVDVAANDLGTFASPAIAIISAPTVGSASVVGGKIRYVAPASGTSASLTYTVTDTSALTSTAATVTITLTAVRPPASDLSISLVANASATAQPLDILTKTGNPAGYKVFVGVPTKADTGWSAVGTLAGSGSSAITYSPVANGVGVYTFTYYVQDSVGTSSATKTVTLTVSPVATTHTKNVAKNASGTTDLASTDIPNTGMTYALVSSTKSPANECTSIAVTSAGSVSYTVANSPGTCTVSYTFQKTAGATTLSAAGTLTLSAS